MTPQSWQDLIRSHWPGEAWEAWIPFLKCQDLEQAPFSSGWDSKMPNSRALWSMSYFLPREESQIVVRSRKPVLRKKQRTTVGRENPDGIINSQTCPRALCVTPGALDILPWWLTLRLFGSSFASEKSCTTQKLWINYASVLHACKHTHTGM